MIDLKTQFVFNFRTYFVIDLDEDRFHDRLQNDKFQNTFDGVSNTDLQDIDLIPL